MQARKSQELARSTTFQIVYILNKRMEETETKILTSDQLPDDPLAMPPPYWRSSGAKFHVLVASQSLSDLLVHLLPVHERTLNEIEQHFAAHEDSESDESLEAFSDICDELWELEHKIKLNAEVAMLMSAIEAESDINRFCVFNLHKDIAETIEKLSPPEKLLVASAATGVPNAKNGAAFEAIKRLTIIPPGIWTGS